ncbi:winged helix-turn-helix domain-containing protein [Marinicella rhabdoformis]|uniref:winged helix-turn-helix domain-containing protein n=1 Tax=Marinicella rhabdoformis TaxID=2580566 RepID=UPI0012AEC2D6|nr:winged helix-turn-helix domain-containing protein [Marinicella rhabdoformis]
MAKQYWLGDFYVDLSRNQITQNTKVQTLAPKALAVLTCLAESHGQVVSQDRLLSQVWPDTVVSPNTLQRSIAQLRKALGDDGKGQSFIKTHAKQGYSLECEVKWQDHTSNSHNKNELPNQEGLKTGEKSTKASAVRTVFVVVAILVFGLWGFSYQKPQPSAGLTFDALHLLTATDDKEFDPTYSPDGQYIVFHRYLGTLCKDRIWAKHIDSQQEIQLTKDWGSYGSHDFSPDGKKLVFFATQACDAPVTQKDCYDLVTLDFEQALHSPQQPNIILQCKQSKVVKPKWISDDHIVMFQKQSERWKLIKYSISDNLSTDLYNPTEGGLIDFAFSPQKHLFAVTRIHSDNQQYIEMLDLDGKLLSSHTIKRPPEVLEHRRIRPNFDPMNDQLIFSTGRQMFTLSYQGEVTKINLPFDDRMIQPVFHPDGDRLLLIKGPYDSDIVKLPLNELQNQNPPSETYESFERSTLGEDYAIFQPGGSLMAFWSERSGEQQLWISDGNTLTMLTDFPTDSFIRGIDWAADGQSLLVNANGVLNKIDLDGKRTIFPMPYAVWQLFQWDSENNTALLEVFDKGVSQYLEYDLNHSTSKSIADTAIKWAAKTADGRLIYKDKLDRFWQPGAVEPEKILDLDHQGDRANSFVIKGHVIYAINSQHQLWSYDLNTRLFTVLGQVREEVDYLTDVSESHVLLGVRMSAKKEVVELTVGK